MVGRLIDDIVAFMKRDEYLFFVYFPNCSHSSHNKTDIV